MRSRVSSRPAGREGSAELMRAIEQIGREKGIDVDYLASAVEDAITTASRKRQERSPGAPPTPAGPAAAQGSGENLISRLDRATGEIQVFARKHVVADATHAETEIGIEEARTRDPQARIGGYVDEPRSTSGLGRIEAQAARQVLLQKVREAERESVFRQYQAKVGHIVHGTVKRFERGDIVLELGKTEAVLPRRHQSRVEMFAQGDSVRALAVEVNKAAKGPQVVLSRTDPLFLIKLFEMEVPEVYDGTVAVRQAVREPGERAKVAVSSSRQQVDAVGACVGMKGSRVQAIVRELRGEKIDVVPWSEDRALFAGEALKPARVERVTLAEPQAGSEPGDRPLEAWVDDSQLSLAIGKKGQNVRLAARLVLGRIEIRSELGKPEAAAAALAGERAAAEPPGSGDTPGAEAVGS